MTTTNNGAAEMTETRTDAATLRKLAKAEGLNVRVRKGKGCRAGNLHFFMRIDATREDRNAALAFLIAVGAKGAIGYGLTDLTTVDGDHFDSITIFSYQA